MRYSHSTCNNRVVSEITSNSLKVTPVLPVAPTATTSSNAAFADDTQDDDLYT